MSLRTLISDLRDAVVELARPGQTGISGLSLWRFGVIGVSGAIVATNLIGAFAVVIMAMVVVPIPELDDVGHVRLVNVIAAAAYVALAVPIGTLIGVRGLRRLRTWLVEERPASARERRIALRAPMRLFALQVALWFAAAAGFGALNLTFDAGLGIRVGITVAITGLVTAACAYLLAERLMRSAAARALADAPPERLAVPGVATRVVLAWALGTGLPVLGLVALGILGILDSEVTRVQLGVVMVALGGIGLTVGLLAVTLAARATADPLDSVRRALSRVQAGEFAARVPVYDGTQVGQLQLGFNRMAAGLAERERIREAFGTYVAPEVAERILEEGTALEGEEVEVTIMFIDIRDFTGFAERSTAPEVVAAINRMFERIVPVIHEHGGHVDKFIGDGLLAVFGAPRRQPDHADRALAAALEIDRAVADELGGELRIGIGLNSGPVVAGNVGGGGRLEFSVIGDPVNVAARVEAATRETGDVVLVSERTRRLLTREEVELEPRPELSLKGKAEPVALYAPR